MKNFKITSILAAFAAVALTGCTSYEIDMPANPEPPVMGPEVPAAVVYQANPRFFADSDCFKAVTAQLPRIAEMGNDILWIMPVNEPGEEKSIGSPYCVRDFTKVNPQYGTLADFKDLVSKAHSAGLKVILDWVANHTAWDCAWITQHPDWYKHDANGNIVSPSGWADVADLDLSNPQAAAAMTDAMTYWVREAGIDGYRCDFVDGVPDSFWSNISATLKASNPDFIMLAETSKFDYYSYGFDMIYDWDSSSAISKAFTGGKPAEVYTEALGALSKVPEGKSILRYALNHDVAAENDVDKMFGSYDALPAAYVCAAMFNGTPLIYSMMDVEGLSGKQSFFDYKTLKFSDALTAKYKAINDAFKQSAEVRRGVAQDFSTSNVVCFTRSIPGHTLVVAVNTTGDARTVKTPITIAGTECTDLLTGQSMTPSYVIELAPYGYSIFMN